MDMCAVDKLTTAKRKALHDNVAAILAGEEDWVERCCKRVRWDPSLPFVESSVV